MAQMGRPDDEELRKYEDNVARATGVLGTLKRWLHFIRYFADDDNLPEFERDYERSREAIEQMRREEIERMEKYKKRRGRW